MRILLLHPNFPAQFRQRAVDWAATGHEVRFLCQTHYGRKLPGVQRLCLKGRASHEHIEGLGLKAEQRCLKMGKQYLIGFNQFLQAGWEPDVVLSHSGWGCGLHARLAFPRAHRIGYVEWWFQPEGLDDLAGHRRNLSMALELADCHTLVAPTAWQRQQLPPALRELCLVIGDGVNTEWFKPCAEASHPTPLLTYGTRGMEATRGFPEFIRALPATLEAHPTLEVEIAGEDRICYSGKPPEGFSSYGQWAQKLLSPWKQRVRFVGVLEPTLYRRWLQRSWIHVYLTRPFVASWSLLEAMAAGCCLVGSSTPPVQEFTGLNGALLVDPWADETWLNRSVSRLLGEPRLRLALGERARQLAQSYTACRSRERWEHVLGQRLATGA